MISKLKDLKIKWSVYAPLVVLGILLGLKLVPMVSQPIVDLGISWIQAAEPMSPSADVIIVDIDPASKERYGTWPYDRKDLGSIINRLRTEGAGVILVDLPLSDPDRAKGDEDMAKAMATRGVILIQPVADRGRFTDYAIKPVKGMTPEATAQMNTYPAVRAPVSKLSAAAAGIGTTDVTRDALRYSMLINVNGQVLPSPILEAMRYTTQELGYRYTADDRQMKISIGSFLNVSMDQRSQIYVNYSHEFKTLSLSQGGLSAVKNKIVVIGSSMDGVNAKMSTPRGPLPTHVIHAHALQTMLDGAPPVRLRWAGILETLLGVSLALVLWYFWHRGPLWINVMKLMPMIGLTAGVPFMALSAANLVFDPVWPTVLMLSVVAVMLIQQYNRHARCYLCSWICGKK